MNKFKTKNLNGKLISWLKNIIHGAIYKSVVDYFSVSAHSSVTLTQGFFGNIVTTLEGV